MRLNKFIDNEKHVYVATTADEYEFCVNMFDKAIDAAKYFNVRVDSIYKAIRRNSIFKKKYRVYKVNLNEKPYVREYTNKEREKLFENIEDLKI